MDYKRLFIKNNLTNIKDFFLFMQNQFKYGWIDQEGNKHHDTNDAALYCLQAPHELLKSHIGNCWDMTELARAFFENMTSFKYETYYLFYDDNKGCPSHSILVFYDHDKVYWFEPMFNDNRFFYSGIHEYDNITMLLKDFKRTFVKYALIHHLIPANYKQPNIRIYRYTTPFSHINGYQMREHINKSEFIPIS